MFLHESNKKKVYKNYIYGYEKDTVVKLLSQT